MSSRTRGSWRRTASATVLTLVLGTLVVLAYRYDGKPFTEVELNDGSVWVTNRSEGLVARLNPQIQELDLGVDAVSADFDIFQQETSLYVDDTASDRSVKSIDIVQAALQEPTALPTRAVVAFGGGTFAVVDSQSGKAWVQPASSFATFEAKDVEPAVTGAVTAAVGTDGRAYVLGRDGRVTPFALDGGAPVAEDAVRLGENVGSDPAMLALTVVGDTPVLFNRASFELTQPGAEPVVVETADSTSVELQQPSAENGEVYVATHDGLFSVPVGGGDLAEVGRGDVAGNPAAPVYLPSAGCVYAAWADPDSPNNYLRDCDDEQYDDTEPITTMSDQAQLQFRVNRDVVVLNDTETGDAWLVQDPAKAKVSNWPSVDPENENRSKLKETTDEIPDQENRPPEPQDDQLGARPGRSTVLPVVALNDHDPDGDIISIERTQHVGGLELEVKIVGGGTQLQVTVPADAEGQSVFKYFVSDGRVNDERSAQVTLQVRKPDQHDRPRLMDDRKPRLAVASGATASYYLLADYYDLDGDDISLVEATARGGDVEFRPDGTITFSDTGAGSKVSSIEYVIEDGFDQVSGKLPVDVLGKSAPPALVPDLSSGVANTRLVVQPLTNDRNPEGRDLTLKSVRVLGDDRGTQVSKDLESGTFTFLATRAKSYYLEYSAYNSSATETSFIRLDIESPPKDNRPPVAVRDKAVVTPGGTAQVDLLLNDLDPDGDVLVVKRIGRASIPGVKVSVVDKRLAVVSSATDIVGQATVDYVVSDGRSSVHGQLVVSQRQSSRANRHPVANKDQVTVRAGSVTTVPVLDNDSDPDGAKPRLFQDDLQNPQDLDVWVAGDSLRLRAPEEAGTHSVIYGVRDAEGLPATAEVSIFVVPDSEKNNQSPLPQPIIDRVISGRPKVISVDLVGADPDGDSVAFRSILTAPSLGRVLDTGVDWLRYEAFDGKVGTDFFQVLVQDKYGATGVAEVRVGVVPPEEENQPPVALDDSVLVQPNRTVSYNVLTNDVDPDDDPLRIEELNSTTGDASHGNGFVEVPVGDAPDAGAAPSSVGYTIVDAAGARDNAVLKVSTSTDAPFYAPVARDDVAELGDIIGREPGDRIEVDVLANDLDFDGAKADLEVTGCDAGSKGHCDPIDGGTKVEVELKARDQVVLYRLDDAEDESDQSFGVIHVTGTENVPPQVTTNEDRIPVEVTAGETVVFDVQDLVVTRAGREATIVADSAPSAINGVVSPVEERPTSLSFTPVRNHVGPASVTVQVTDGRSPAEESALTSLLTFPIDVKPAGNVAPTMRDASVDVTAGGDPAEVDLAGLTEDANEDDLASMTWTLKSADGGLTATIDDTILSLEAGDGEDGDVLRATVVADDGNGGEAEAVVTARVVGSNLPLLRVGVISVTGVEDESMTVDVAEDAVNPHPGEPIEVSDPRVEGSGQISDLEVNGSAVTFTPTETGTSTITVTVSDASGDRTRDVIGRIVVTVIAVPDAPTRPTLSSVEASSAVLTWQVPEANGAAIEEYEVRGSHGYQKSCAANTCLLDDLTPGDSYTFTVRARNSEGWGDESPQSEEITPNKAPDLMSPPTIVEEPRPTGGSMDRQLTVRWTPPANEGSEITSYEIKEAGSSQTWTAGGGDTSKVITGLTNGTPYAFEIRAVNAVEPKREFSGPSRAVQPFGIPLRSGVAPRLTASEDSPFTQSPWVRIDWSAWTDSQSNGNPVTGYVVTCDGCSRSRIPVDRSSTSLTLEGDDGIQKGKTVTLTVAATNEAGTSDPSPSVSGRPWTKAGPVRNLREVGTSPADETARLAWDAPADDGGLPIAYYVVRFDSGATINVPSAPSGGTDIDFGRNGTHSVDVWAVTRNGDRAVTGESDSLNGIDTWGKPFAPTTTVNDAGHYTVDITVNAGGANGTKRVTGVQWSEDGSSWSDHRSGDHYTAEVADGGSSRTIWVRTVSEADGDRKYSDAVQVTGRSVDKWLSIKFACNLVGNCEIKVSGDGFVKEARVASVNTGSLTIVNPDNCGSFDQSVTGSFDYEVGGNNCRFSGTGTATVSLTDRTASVSR